MTYSEKKEIDIYHRILRYCPFALTQKRKKGMDITKYLPGGGRIRITCFETANFEDADVLFAIAYLASLAAVENAATVFEHEHVKTIRASFYIRDISLLIHSNDYHFIKNSIERLTSLTIFYSDKKKSEPQRFLQHFHIDEEDKFTTVYLDYAFWEACLSHGLTINVERLLNLKSGAAKALYMIITANSGIDELLEKTLVERIGIEVKRKDRERRTLRRALDNLVEGHIIAGFSFRKNAAGESMIKIVRYRDLPPPRSVEGGEIVPQVGDLQP